MTTRPFNGRDLNLVLKLICHALVPDGWCGSDTRQAYSISSGKIDIAPIVPVALIVGRWTRKETKVVVRNAHKVFSWLVTLKAPNVANVVSITGRQ